MTIYTDPRWPVGTGIERLYRSYSKRAPAWARLHELPLKSSIGSPISCAEISLQLMLARAGRQDLFWNPGFVPPLGSKAPAVVTVHDLTHLHFYTEAHRIYYNVVLKPLFTRCHSIVCISDFTRNEFIEWSGISAKKVVYIPNGIEPDFAELGALFHPSRPFLFYAGNRRSYKNVPLMVESFFNAGLHKAGLDLVLTGDPDANLLEIARSVNGESSLRFVGFLSDSELVSHYKSATAVLFLSSYEGFGLPILEAMACGVPVVLSNCSSFPEVANDAALFVDVSRSDSVVEGLKKITESETLRRALVIEGEKRLRAYSLDVSAQRLWDHLSTAKAS